MPGPRPLSNGRLLKPELQARALWDRVEARQHPQPSSSTGVDWRLEEIAEECEDMTYFKMVDEIWTQNTSERSRKREGGFDGLHPPLQVSAGLKSQEPVEDERFEEARWQLETFELQVGWEGKQCVEAQRAKKEARRRRLRRDRPWSGRYQPRMDVEEEQVVSDDIEMVQARQELESPSTPGSEWRGGNRIVEDLLRRDVEMEDRAANGVELEREEKSERKRDRPKMLWKRLRELWSMERIDFWLQYGEFPKEQSHVA